MTKKFIYYQDNEMFVGWMEEYPDYKTQGDSLQELMDNLLDIYHELTGGNIPNVLHVGELQIA